MAEDREAGAARRSGVTIDEVLRPSNERKLKRLPALVVEAFRLVWRAARAQFALAGALQLFAAVSLGLQLLVMRSLIDRVVADPAAVDLAALAPSLLAFGVLLLVSALAALAQREQQGILAELIGKYTTGRVLDVSTRVELIEYDRPAFYDQLQRARVNANVRPLQIANGVVGLLGAGAAVAAVSAALLWIEPWLVVIIAVGGLPSLWINRRSAKLMHAFAVRQTAADRRRAYLYQTLSRKEEAHEVRAFDSAHHLRDEHDRLYDDRLADLRTTLRKRLWLGALSAALAAGVIIGSLGLLLWFVSIGRLEVSSAAVAVGAVVLVAGRIRGLIASAGSLYEGSLFLRDFTDFVATYEAAAEQTGAVAPAALPPFRRIELRNVGFTYPSRSEPSLHDVSLTIEQGEVIAFVGENGSGKTTLTKLLAGLYRPGSGSVLWDGRDTADVPMDALREQVTVIFQDFARYFLSAHENIAVSRIGRVGDGDGVVRAAGMAGAEGFLSRLPQGFRTLLGPAFVGGSDLSGGQWQRVALARAYFRDAPLLILDEPTAALDPRGEYEIFQRVRQLAEGRTVILVSHRFSSVRAADRIVVLDGGRIVEDGPHEALVARGGLYAELFEMQAEGYRATGAGGVAG